MLLIAIFVNFHSLAIASLSDESTDTELASLNSSLNRDIQEGSEIDQISDTLETTLQKIPFLSQKENVHMLSRRLKYFDPLDPEHIIDNAQCSVFLGTGLKCLRTRSHGIPFDILGFIAAAEATRKIYGFKNIIHYIGDKHARLGGFNSEGFSSLEEWQTEVKQQKLLYERIARKLGIEATYKIVLASDIQETPEFTLLKEFVFRNPGLEGQTDYTKLEIADIEYFRKYQHARVKFSWIMHEEQNAKRDEVSYDQLYRSIFTNEDISFLYAKSGVKLNRQTNYSPIEIDSSPYSYPVEDTRITLLPIDRVHIPAQNCR